MMRRVTVAVLALLPLAFAAGCGKGGTPTTGGSGGGSGTTGPNPTSLTFASTSVGSSAPTQTVTFTNGGTTAITFTNLPLSGTNPGDYSVAGTCSTATPLAAGSTCTAIVTFTPTASGTRTSALGFAYTGGTGSPAIVTLTGTATASSADFLNPPANLLFGTTVVNSTTAAQTLTFKNSGTGPDTLSAIALSGTNAGDFAVANGGTCTNTSVIAAAASCTVNVTYTPLAPGTSNATLTITDNSNGIPGTVHTATLTGTAVATAAPTVTVSPSTLNFSATTAQTVTVTNAGAVAVAMNATPVTITGTNPASFSQTNDCGTSIAVGGFCTISVHFVPGSATGAQAATLNIADNVAGSPQTVALSGTASAVESLTPAALSFTEATSATTTAAQTVTLTNTGTASMSSIATSFTGAGAATFTKTSAGTCGTTLAAGASCTFTITFTPSANGQVTAAFSVTSNASNSAQTVALTGYGPGSSQVSMTLVTVPDDTYAAATVSTLPPVNTFVNSATSTIDMTIYELTDTTLLNNLITQCKTNGVRVRVLLNVQTKSRNQSAYNALTASTATNCSAVFSNSHFANTHQKSVVIDAAIPAKARVLISTGNFDAGSNASCGTGCVYNYYVTGRDFELYENNPNDVAAVESTFQEDWTYSSGTTYPSFTPNNGDDLVWSPTNATSAITGVIANATSTLVVDQEEMSAATCYNALAAAAQRGVNVKLTAPEEAFSASANKMQILANLKAAGVHVNQYPSDGNYLYIHAKAIVADAGTANETAFLGSENCSAPLLTQNRELGIVLTDASSPDAAAIITKLNTVLSNDNACISKAPTQATASCQ